jgi:uncharacterized protein (DUF4415 family)
MQKNKRNPRNAGAKPKHPSGTKVRLSLRLRADLYDKIKQSGSGAVVVIEEALERLFDGPDP